MKANNKDLLNWINFEIMELAAFLITEAGPEGIAYAIGKLTSIQNGMRGMSQKEAESQISELYEKLRKA